MIRDFSSGLSQLFLILIIYLDYDNADGLVFTICCHLGDVPVAWKEDEEFARIAVVETGLLAVVIIMNYVWTVLAVGGAGVVVDHAKTLCALYYILKIDVLMMTLAAALFQRLVLAVLYTYHEVGTRNLVLSLRNAQQIGLCQIVEERLPLLRILLILQIEIYEVYAGMWLRLVETIAPDTALSPSYSLFYEFGLIAVILCVITSLTAAFLC